jgi:hypothetical protein
VDFNKIKKIGPILKFIYNMFIAGRVITVKGTHITLPPLSESQVITAAPVSLESLLKK